MIRSLHRYLGFLVLLAPSTAVAQTLSFYGGAGVSGDHFSFDKTVVSHKASFTVGQLVLAGLRYHTLQDFDIMLDASLGINKIKVPVPAGYSGNMQYKQLQSLILVGSGLNIPVRKGNLMPFIQLGAGFLDFWSMTSSADGPQNAIITPKDYNTNRWTVVCGAGMDYQFRFFLSSAVNLRLIYTPLNIFNEPATVAYASNTQGTTAVRLQGKLLQAQLTYRINIPLATWREPFD